MTYLKIVWANLLTISLMLVGGTVMVQYIAPPNVRVSAWALGGAMLPIWLSGLIAGLNWPRRKP